MATRFSLKDSKSPLLKLFDIQELISVCSWDDETFVSSYINIPIFIILYFTYKFIKKTKIIPLSEIPIRHFIDIANANPEPSTKPVVGWRRLNILWS